MTLEKEVTKKSRASIREPTSERSPGMGTVEDLYLHSQCADTVAGSEKNCIGCTVEVPCVLSD